LGAAISPPELLVAHTAAAMQHPLADALALDFLEQENGQFVVPENNDTPGLSVPDEVRDELLRRLSQSPSSAPVRHPWPRRRAPRMRIREVVDTPDAVASVLHGARAPPGPPPPGQLVLLH
jgi:hypothetical protein